MCDHNECPTCLQDWIADTDYECGCCERPASEHIRVTSLCRILRETQQREHALIVERNKLLDQLAAERALADRLHGALDALDYNLAFAENVAHGSIREKITIMRSIALPAIEAWKEARRE